MQGKSAVSAAAGSAWLSNHYNALPTGHALPSMPITHQHVRRAGILLLLWLTGVYMRAPIMVAAPLGEQIREELGFAQTALGMLTTLPVFMLGLGALPAAWLIGRFGARGTLTAALFLTAIASLLRGTAPNLYALLALTALMGLGIAAMQPALPALVGRWCPGFVALGSTVYINGMMLGEFIGAGLTLPVLLPAVDDSWRTALLVFSIPALLILPWLYRPTLQGQRQPARARRKMPDWRDKHMWQYGAALGASAATFFGLNAYMGSLLARRDMADSLDTTLFFFNFAQIGASVVMMIAARHVLRTPRLLAITIAVHIVGVTGLLLAPNEALIGIAVMLSAASALQLVSLTTLPALVRTPDEAGRLAAGMFAIGYVLAFVIPLIAGLATDMSGTINAGLGVLLLFNLLCLPLIWRAPTHD
ncbi:major facilitator superfamily transporter [Salinisphaera dokdonensis CL-ES53]|uniref:Major facilitator superfamily transporter n=2 Tax=Salinisphaera TaxID=180541 RepID=A0ABV2AYB6_9GAMM